MDACPLIGWTDFSLIPDKTCRYVIDGYARRKLGMEGGFDAIVLSKDHARMWSLNSSLLRNDQGLTSGTMGRKIDEFARPYWVDDRGIVRFLSDELVDEKCTNDACDEVAKKSRTNRIEEADNEPFPYQRIRDVVETAKNQEDLRRQIVLNEERGRRPIKVVLIDNMKTLLATNPALRLLVIDAYEEFLTHVRFKYPNVWFAFTSAPTTLTDVLEDNFYERLNDQTNRISRILEQNERVANLDIPDDEDDYDEDDHIAKDDAWTRGEYLGWCTFVPSVDYLPSKYTDVRVTSTHLFDDGGSRLFWRNVVYAQLREMAKDKNDGRNNDGRKNGDDVNDKRAMVIRLRFELNADETFASTKDPTLAVMRRFKRFLAFLVRVYRIIDEEKITDGPHLYWTCCDEEMHYCTTLRKLLTREFLIGDREKIGNHDRFIRLNATIRSSCAIRKKEMCVNSTTRRNDDEASSEATNNEENVRGVQFHTLLDQNWYKTRVSRIGASAAFIEQKKNCLPISHLREYED